MTDAAVAARIDALAAAWNARDTARLAALWALDDAGVYYLAAGAREAFFGPEAVAAHFHHHVARHSKLHWRIDGLRVRVLETGDLATAFFFVDVAARRAEPAGAPEQAPVGNRLKCAATLRREGADWRFLHLVEAAYAPYRFFVSDFERDAEDGFAGMPERVAP